MICLYDTLLLLGSFLLVNCCHTLVWSWIGQMSRDNKLPQNQDGWFRSSEESKPTALATIEGSSDMISSSSLFYGSMMSLVRLSWDVKNGVPMVVGVLGHHQILEVQFQVNFAMTVLKYRISKPTSLDDLNKS